MSIKLFVASFRYEFLFDVVVVVVFGELLLLLLLLLLVLFLFIFDEKDDEEKLSLLIDLSDFKLQFLIDEFVVATHKLSCS